MRRPEGADIMKKQKQAVCPGCSRHCAADAIRCKRGRAYFDKLREKHPEALMPQQTALRRKHKKPWEKLVEEGGAVWTLLAVGREIKKALRSGRISERQLTEALSEAELFQLTEFLSRLNARLPEKNFDEP